MLTLTSDLTHAQSKSIVYAPEAIAIADDNSAHTSSTAEAVGHGEAEAVPPAQPSSSAVAALAPEMVGGIGSWGGANMLTTAEWKSLQDAVLKIQQADAELDEWEEEKKAKTIVKAESKAESNRVRSEKSAAAAAQWKALQPLVQLQVQPQVYVKRPFVFELQPLDESRRVISIGIPSTKSGAKNGNKGSSKNSSNSKNSESENSKSTSEDRCVPSLWDCSRKEGHMINLAPAAAAAQRP